MRHSTRLSARAARAASHTHPRRLNLAAPCLLGLSPGLLSPADLLDAVSSLRPRRLVPTVNAATPAARRALVDRFAALMDLREDRSRWGAGTPWWGRFRG